MSETRREDARGLKCPLPVLKARRWVKEMRPGDILEILVTDPGAPEDFRHFCDLGGHIFLAAEPDGAGAVAIRLAIKSD